MRCVGVEDPLCERARRGDVEDFCSVFESAGWTCDDSWGTQCMGDHPSGAEYNSYTVFQGGACPERCGARGAAFALSRYIHQAGTFIFAESVED